MISKAAGFTLFQYPRDYLKIVLSKAAGVTLFQYPRDYLKIVLLTTF